jgi:hypothetical protein
MVGAQDIDWLTLWKAIVRKLDLPVADPLKGEVPPSDRRAIQPALDKTAEQLDALWKESRHNRSSRLKLRHLRPHLVPYLHGRISRPDRVAPSDGFTTVRAFFHASASSTILTKEVTISDICRRTSRGFRIEVPGLSIAQGFVECGSPSGLYVDRRPCCAVDAQDTETLASNTIDAVTLEVAYPTSDGKQTTSVQCRVLRARQEHYSAWALLADDSTPLPDAWKKYVHALSAAPAT